MTNNNSTCLADTGMTIKQYIGENNTEYLVIKHKVENQLSFGTLFDTIFVELNECNSCRYLMVFPPNLEVKASLNRLRINARTKIDIFFQKNCANYLFITPNPYFYQMNILQFMTQAGKISVD